MPTASRDPSCARHGCRFAIYSFPEVSYIGDTEDTLKDKGIPYVVGRGHDEMNPRGHLVGALGGIVKLIFVDYTRKPAGG